MVISVIVAPLTLAAILGFAFGQSGPPGVLPIGVSGASPALVRAAAQATQLPPNVVVHRIASARELKAEVAAGTLSGGVILTAPRERLSDLMIPVVAPGATHSPGFKVVSQASSLVGQEWAESVAAGLASCLYAGHLHPGSATEHRPPSRSSPKASATPAAASSTTSPPPSPWSSSSSAVASACDP